MRVPGRKIARSGEEAWDVSGNETDEEERERRGGRGASNQESTSEREDAVDA